MKKTYSYIDCYRILGAKPDNEWSELRKIYKKSIQKWHPDRYKEGSDEKSAADDKIKSINIAYNQISTYYRKSGSLPPTERQTSSKPVPAKPTHKDRTHPNKKRQENNKSTAKRKPEQHLQKTSKHLLRSSFLLITFATVAYYIFTDDININYSIPDFISEQQENYAPISDMHMQKQSKDKISAQKNNFYQPTNHRYFTIGSNISDVISIQGTPTRTEGDIWFYGESEVHFREGQVIRWVRSIETPLKANLDYQQNYR